MRVLLAVLLLCVAAPGFAYDGTWGPPFDRPPTLSNDPTYDDIPTWSCDLESESEYHATSIHWQWTVTQTTGYVPPSESLPWVRASVGGTAGDNTLGVKPPEAVGGNVLSIFPYWPSAVQAGTTTPFVDGTYQFEFEAHAEGWIQPVPDPRSAGTITMTVVNGVFGGVGTGGGGDDTGTLFIKVKSAGDPVAGASVSVSNAQTLEALTPQTTTGTGVVTWNVQPGSYLVNVGLGGKFAQRYAWVNKDRTSQLVVNFPAGDGPAEWTGGDDTPGDGSTGNWLVDLLRTLLVPKEAKLTQAQESMESFWNWGPVALVSQLQTILATPAGAGVTFQYDSPEWDNVNNTWVPGSTPVVLSDMFWITEASWWATFRALMGGAVWLSFLGAVIAKMMPRQTV